MRQSEYLHNYRSFEQDASIFRVQALQKHGVISWMIRMCIIRCPEEQLLGSTYRTAQMILIVTAFSSEAVRQESNPEHSGVNFLKTKLNLLYLKTQSIPCSKHFSSRL